MQYEKRLLIPALTSNTGNPNFKITASSVYDSTYDAWKAFNGTNISAIDCWASSDDDTSPYLIIEMKDYHYICGYTISSRHSGTAVGAGEWKVSISDNGTTWKEIFTMSAPTTENTEKSAYIPRFKARYIKIQSLNAVGYKCIGELNFYEIKEFFVIGKDNKYYSFREEQYNSETQTFNELTLEQINTNILTDGYLSELGYLTKSITVGEETFKPIDKFADSFSLVSVENTSAILNGIKSKKELVKANNDFSLAIAKNIDKFIPTYNVSDGTEIKIVVSTDSGTTWKTTGDNGTTWTDLESLTTDTVLTSGIDISNLEKVNFNTLYSVEDFTRKCRFSYAFKINNTADDVNTSKLELQFDAKGKFNKVSPDISLTQDSIFITPKEDMAIMKVNVGTGGAITIQEVTNNITTEFPTDEEITAMIKEVMGNE